MKLKEIEELFKEENEKYSEEERMDPVSEYSYVQNDSGYTYKGSENFEHDNTGNAHNFSGMADQLLSAISEQDAWEEGYDY